MEVYGNIDTNYGQLQNAKVHSYLALPAYSSPDDDGRVIYVSVGAQRGYWFGNADGTNNWSQLKVGSALAEWNENTGSLANGATLQDTLTCTGDIPATGILTKVTITSTIAAGYVTVSFYNDAARGDKFYECIFDIASGILVDNLATGFELDNTAGQIYIDVTNNTGSAAIVTVEAKGAAIIPVPISAPPGTGTGINSSVAGDGIEYNVVAQRLDLDLLSTGGLTLIGASPAKELSVKGTPSGGLSIGASGVGVDSTVLRTTGAQTPIAGSKMFDQPGMVPTAISGPPVAGAHLKGEFSMDQNQDIWMCTVAGTPGTWTFWGWKEQNIGPAYTAQVTHADSLTISATATGRRGVIRKAMFWAVAPAYAAVNIDAPFRVECFPNENYEGRESLWQLSGQARTTFISGAVAPPATTVGVNSVGSMTLGDLVRMRALLTSNEEYARTTVRTPGGPSMDVDETIIYTYAANDPFMVATEALELYWKNNSAVPGNYYKIYLKIFNDHPTQDLIFGYHLYVENIGGGLPV